LKHQLLETRAVLISLLANLIMTDLRKRWTDERWYICMAFKSMKYTPDIKQLLSSKNAHT